MFYKTSSHWASFPVFEVFFRELHLNVDSPRSQTGVNEYACFRQQDRRHIDHPIPARRLWKN
jgi:hypothetical protein